MRTGRPLKLLEDYPTPDDLDAACDAFFETRKAEGRPATLSGLAYWLGCDKRTLERYVNGEGKRGDFCRPLKRAWLALADEYECRGASERGNPAFSIFALKNFGWSDRQEVGLELQGDGWGALLGRVRGRASEPEDG